jgi:hypothetical protein
VQRFYDVYGNWFATWKLWEACRQGRPDSPHRAELLEAASRTEGQFEALLIKVALDRTLSPGEIDRLGRLREGYQRLRECIESNARVPFRVQYDDDEASAYATFKSLSVEFAFLTRGKLISRRPAHEQAKQAFVQVTSWRADGDAKDAWWRDTEGMSVAQAAGR